MKKIAFLTPADAEFGFGLAGVFQCVAQQQETEERLMEIMSESNTGLIVIDERMIQMIDEKRMREMEERWKGILIVLPSPIKPAAGVEDYAIRLIVRAIGYHARLQL